MATWNSRGLRGSTLEELINRTNEQYREKGLALIQKVPTPITPIRIDQEHRHITLAYFDKKSTVDYIGAVQGIPVCFDAKECQTEVFPLANIHENQLLFMNELENQKGEAFMLMYFAENRGAEKFSDGRTGPLFFPGGGTGSSGSLSGGAAERFAD